MTRTPSQITNTAMNGLPRHLSIHVGGMISFLQAPFAESRPADTSIEELRAWLIGRPPDVLSGYSSVIGHLASETIAGHLSIRPSVVPVTAEPATPEIVSLVRDAWGVGLMNLYSTTECPALAQSEPGSDALHLHEDIAIVEVVANDNLVMPYRYNVQPQVL